MAQHMTEFTELRVQDLELSAPSLLHKRLVGLKKVFKFENPALIIGELLRRDASRETEKNLAFERPIGYGKEVTLGNCIGEGANAKAYDVIQHDYEIKFPLVVKVMIERNDLTIAAFEKEKRILVSNQDTGTGDPLVVAKYFGAIRLKDQREMILMEKLSGVSFADMPKTDLQRTIFRWRGILEMAVKEERNGLRLGDLKVDDLVLDEKKDMFRMIDVGGGLTAQEKDLEKKDLVRKQIYYFLSFFMIGHNLSQEVVHLGDSYIFKDQDRLAIKLHSLFRAKTFSQLPAEIRYIILKASGEYERESYESFSQFSSELLLFGISGVPETKILFKTHVGIERKQKRPNQDSHLLKVFVAKAQLMEQPDNMEAKREIADFEKDVENHWHRFADLQISDEYIVKCQKRVEEDLIDICSGRHDLRHMSTHFNFGEDEIGEDIRSRAILQITLALEVIKREYIQVCLARDIPDKKLEESLQNYLQSFVIGKKEADHFDLLPIDELRKKAQPVFALRDMILDVKEKMKESF